MAGALRQSIHIASLEAYIRRNVPEIKVPITVEQFGYGQSNPTYNLTSTENLKYVLRKKPPGKLVSKTAHQIEREYQIIRALQKTDIPVPKLYCFCEDDNVLDTPFYIMEFLCGRIFEDPSMPEVTPAERQEMWLDAARTLAKLHRLNPADVGLQNFGKPFGFYDRQIKTFGKICKSQADTEDIETGEPVGEIPHLEETLRYFSDKKKQPQDKGCLIHGDYKIDNIVFHETAPKVVGILDWEMSTIGHPLSDLANFITSYPLGNQISIQKPPSSAVETKLGLPIQHELMTLYAQITGWDPSPDLVWGMTFALFRGTVILQGIASRYAMRQASSARAKEMADRRHLLAAQTWEQILKNLAGGKIRESL